MCDSIYRLDWLQQIQYRLMHHAVKHWWRGFNGKHSNIIIWLKKLVFIKLVSLIAYTEKYNLLSTGSEWIGISINSSYMK